MKTLSDQFGEIVEERLKALDTNTFAVEQANGLPPDAIRNVLRSQKKAGPTLSRAEEICRALDLEFYIGPRRPRDHGFHEPGGNGAPTILAPPTGYATFVWEGGDLRGIPPLAFSQAWITRNGLDIDRHTCVWVGDAPADSAAPAAIAVIDRMSPQTGGPTLWALEDRGRSVELARLQFDGKTAVALPDSPDTPARFIRPGGGTILLGRVLWRGTVEGADNAVFNAV